ncbi:MAG: hypothetical protein KAI43_07240 [Candidatus Aureabacteria bacterium]|nr:hypothetical protein [Candidatus Auribacterota bacterium]
MRPIDIQNAIDRVQTGERLLQARKMDENDDNERFSKRLSEETAHKKESVKDTEQTEGLIVDDEGSNKNQYSGKKKKREQDGKEIIEEKKIKEDGKGNILDMNA